MCIRHFNIFDVYFLMIKIRIILFLALVVGFASTLLAQDRLLLTNGKVKQLTGVVVYYDYNLVLYQNDRQAERMQVYDLKNKEQVSSEVNGEKNAARLLRSEQRSKEKLKRRRKIFEEEVKERMERLSAADFEKWKNRELDRLKAEERKQNVDAAVNKQVKEAKTNRREARKRGKFTKAVLRSRVFSILKADGTEIVIYNADTLGFFADGEAELEYGVAEMRMYIKGRQDGRKHGFHDFWIGAGSGLITSLAMTWYLDAFYAPIFPAATVAFMTLFPIKINPKLGVSVDQRLSVAYIDGYERSASGRKVMAFSLGSLVGMSVGIGTGLATAPLLR